MDSDSGEMPQDEPLTQMGWLLRNHGADPRIYKQLRKFQFRKFTTVQYLSVLNNLFQGTSLLVCASTGSGKTLVGEMACINIILTTNLRCAYLVPLKSLASEKYQAFRKRWDALGIAIEMSTGDMNLLDRKAEEEKLKTVRLLIMTYERADSILRSHPSWFSGVQVVVIDEVHNLAARERGARLEGLIVRLKHWFQGTQFIYLSATIGNPEALAHWLGCKLIKHHHRPVVLDYEIMLHPDRLEKIQEIVRDTLRQQGSVLVFAPGRYEAEQLCSKISEFLKEQELLYLIDTPQLRELTHGLRDRVGDQFDQRLYFSIPRGVAFHHAGLSSVMRNFIERYFREGLIKVVTSTPTLSSGVNMPAKVVVIQDVGLNQFYRQLEVNELHQMCGRAGRPGFDQHGKAIILSTSQGERNDIALSYFRHHSLIPKYESLESQFLKQDGTQDNLLEQYLVWIAASREGITEAELKEMTYKSFWYEAQRQVNPHVTIAHLTRLGYYSLENILQRHSKPKAHAEAERIPKSAVKIRRIDSYKLEAIVFDRSNIICSFSRKAPDCGCGLFDSKRQHKASLCRHLIRLAQVAFEKHPAYTRDIVLAAFHEERLVSKLARFGMIKIRNGRLHASRFGQQTVRLYLHPQTAFWIRRILPKIWSREKLYFDLLHACKMERDLRLKRTQLLEALKHLLEDECSDFTYHAVKVALKCEIHPGDMEEFVMMVRWMLNCFHELATMDQIGAALSLTKLALERLVPGFGTEKGDLAVYDALGNSK